MNRSWYQPEPVRKSPFTTGRYKAEWDRQIAEGRAREKAERQAGQSRHGARSEPAEPAA